MSQTITISLPDDTKDALDTAASEENVPENVLVEEGVKSFV